MENSKGKTDLKRKLMNKGGLRFSTNLFNARILKIENFLEQPIINALNYLALCWLKSGVVIGKFNEGTFN